MNLTERVASPPEYPPGWLVGQLPVGMRDDDLFVRFTTIFERVGATLRAGADGVDHIADPTVTTPAMLVYLGRWLGYDVLDPDLDVGRQRSIISALGQALPWRGTANGLQILLAAITDGPVQITDPGGVYGPDGPGRAAEVVEVRVASSGHLREHELASLVRDEIPAHLGVSLFIDGTEVL